MRNGAAKRGSEKPGLSSYFLTHIFSSFAVLDHRAPVLKLSVSVPRVTLVAVNLNMMGMGKQVMYLKLS